MKLRVSAIALFICLTITAVPMRSFASSDIAEQTNDDLITELIV
jgi:hypothetical protein